MSTLRRLEDEILSADKLQRDGTPSASIAILEDGAISTHIISNGSEDAETIYQCGSISKAITAMGVARMVDLGHLSYDTKIVDVLPAHKPSAFLEPQSVHLLDLVTVRMLITHTSGLTQPYEQGHPRDVETLPTKEQSIQGHSSTNLIRLQFGSLPGAQLLYCSGSFTLLEIAMEHITGKTFAELMQELVMRPLGMQRTFYGDLPDDEKNFTKPYLNGFQPTPIGVHRFTELAAVGLWSTPTDLLKLVSAIQQSIHSEGGFLKPATAHEILISGAVTFRSGAAQHRCGLGWYSTFTTFAHRGANPGYHSYVFGFFDQADLSLHRSGFSIMTNSLLGLESIRPIFSAMLYLKGWPRQKLMPSSLGVDDYVPFAAPEGTEIDEAWREWKGQWDHDWSLLEVQGQPALQLKDLPPVKLLPAAAPVQTFDDNNTNTEIILVADGLSATAIRLTWADNDRIIELLQLAKTVLKKRLS
ncbi:hypothetical protein PRZ48_008647 [Zasmidium cellare]|uniref:Beta-lactamase-related domain-containing protein n=1 Tax=Zasmidium cellare TaxID=395010 RepID=A0ABR0EH52_ZASCE|nr:hypothetical protein PRZ48_008647 [Zasmidium cellare]